MSDIAICCDSYQLGGHLGPSTKTKAKMSALEKMKERQAKRRQLLAQSLGVEDPTQLGTALGFNNDASRPDKAASSTIPVAGASGGNTSKMSDDLPSSLSASKKV